MSDNLPQTRDSIAAALAANGLSDPTIREELGMTSQAWNAEVKRPHSPLAQALADGRARIVENALSVVIEAVKAGDVAPAKWLVDRFSPRDSKQDQNSVHITLTMPRQMKDYLELVEAEEVEPDDQ